MIVRDTPDREIKVVVFDVEGVLIESRTPLPFSGGGYFLSEAARRKGLFTYIEFLFISLLYVLRIFSINRAVRSAFMLLKGLDKGVFQSIFDVFTVPPRLSVVFSRLTESGIKIALVSYGIPSFLLHDFAERRGADYAYGIDLEMEDGIFTGKIGGPMSQKDGKVFALNQICRLEGVSPEECAAIADDRSNCSLFRTPVFSIALNSGRDLSRCADIILEGRALSAVLFPIFSRSGSMPRVHPFTLNDLTRLLVHISGLWVPYLGLFMGVRFLLILILFVILIYCLSEFLRLQGRVLPLITAFTTFAARKRELRQFVFAPVYFALGILIVLLFFPDTYGFAGIAVLTLGDSTASFVGGLMGRTRLPYNRLKSLEGSLAGIIMGMIGGALFIDLYLAAVGSCIGMLVESLPVPFDDNAVVPVSAAAAMYLAAHILGL